MSYQGHALDEITVDGTFEQARSAAAFTRATGSVAGSLDGFEVERVAGPAFRVSANNVVIVLAGVPGQYTSHALSDLEQAIKDEVDAAEAPEPEAEEDYLRALLHNEDI